MANLTLNEIPREGDLKDVPDSHAELIALQNTVETTGTTSTEVTEQRQQLEKAIRSGNRADVVRALQRLQTNAEFGQLRDRINQNRLSVSGSTFGLGVMDQTIVRGEQTARTLYNNAPNFLKLGVITGAATWVLTWPAQWIAKLWGGGENIAKHRGKIAAGIGTLIAGGKLVTDSMRESGGFMSAVTPPTIGQVPNLDLGAREKRMVDMLSRTQWQRPLTNNTFILPAITDLSAFPIGKIVMTHYANNVAQLSTELTETNADPRYKVSSAADRTFGAAANVDKVTIQFSLTGETTLRPTPPITIDKPTA